MHIDPLSARLKLSILSSDPKQIVMYFLGEKVRSITRARGKLLSVLYCDQRSHSFIDETSFVSKIKSFRNFAKFFFTFVYL